MQTKRLQKKGRQDDKTLSLFHKSVTLNLFKPPSPAWGSEFALCRTKPD